jgi:hypothetical protein
LWEQPVSVQATGKGAGGLHRPDGMRARRADADFEQVEDADRHALIHQVRILPQLLQD